VGASGSLSPPVLQIDQHGGGMTRETEWAVFEKACDITASAVRGAMNGADGQRAAFVGEVFREVHAALTAVAAEMPDRNAKAGF
jgi:hypothetical protein